MSLATLVKSEDLFNQLGKEKREEIRSIDLKKNPSLEMMSRNFLNLCDTLFGSDKTEYLNPDQTYEESIYSSCVSKIPKTYATKDIETFFIAANESMFKRVGYFKAFTLYTAALINNSQENGPFVINTGSRVRLEWLECLGYKNTKDIIIKKFGGDNLGYGMKNGTIIVEGDIGSFVGNYMEGGEIYVKGNAGSDLGCHMTGGTITVDGDARLPIQGGSGGNIVIKGKLLPAKYG